MRDLWTWLGDPLHLTAAATAALAILAAVALVANVILTAATWRALRLQLRELKLLEAQVKLAQDQARSARALAKPEIRARVTKFWVSAVSGELTWSHGSSPAYDVEVWIKLADARLLRGRPRYMAPGDKTKEFVVGEAAAEETICPFEWSRSEAPPEGEYWLGVTWRAADGASWGYSERVIQEHRGVNKEGKEVTYSQRTVPGPDPEMLPDPNGDPNRAAE